MTHHRRNIVLSFLTCGALVLSLLIPTTVLAQVAGATLSGTVTDQSGAVVPNSRDLHQEHRYRSHARTVTTDRSWILHGPELVAGNLRDHGHGSGICTEVQTGITLTVGAQQVLNFTMRVGQVTETVQVTGEAPAVQLATSSISAVVNSTTVRELPLNGRSWTDLATLQPGVDSIQNPAHFGAGPDRGNRGFGDQITVAGARPSRIITGLMGSASMITRTAPGKRAGRQFGGGCDPGVFRLNEQLFRRVRQDVRRGGECHYAFRDESVPWRRLRVSPQQRSRCSKFLRWRHDSAFPPQSVRSRCRRADPEGQGVCLRRL